MNKKLFILLMFFFIFSCANYDDEIIPELKNEVIKPINSDHIVELINEKK